MDVPQDQFKKDTDSKFKENSTIAVWETEPTIDAAGDEVIHVGLSKGELTIKEAQDLPSEIDGVKIVYYYTGELRFMTHQRYDPLFGGCSIAAIDITAGTNAHVVWDKDTLDPYFLTNEHVVSNSENVDTAYPPVGHPIVQPGPLDGGKYPNDIVGYLNRVGGMKMAALSGKPCNIDAALVDPVRDYDPTVFLGLGSLVERKHVHAKVGDEVIKSGRTTGVTTNVVSAVNVSANIGGLSWGNPVTMEGLIQTQSSFVQGGDSGSRVWKKNTMQPIGLVFAGSWLTSLIIPAQTICDAFNITFCREEPDVEPQPNPDPDYEKSIPWSMLGFGVIGLIILVLILFRLF